MRYTLTVRNVSEHAASLWTVLPEQSLNVVVRRADDRTVYDRLVADFDGTVALVARSQMHLLAITLGVAVAERPAHRA